MSSSNVILHGKNYNSDTIIPVAVDDNGDLKIISDTPTSLSEMTDVSLTSLADTNLLQYDSATSKWINRSTLSGNVGFSNLAITNTLTTSNMLITGNLNLLDTMRTINGGTLGNLDMNSSIGNVNITAQRDIFLNVPAGSSIRFHGENNLPIMRFFMDSSGNSYMNFGTISGETGYGFKAILDGNVFIRPNISGIPWNLLSNTTIGIGNSSIKLGDAYTGIDLSNSTGYSSNNLVGSIPVSIIDDGLITNNKLANSTVTLAGRTVALGGNNIINLSNLNDVLISGLATNDTLNYNGSNWINSNSVILSNLTVRNATDTVGVCICPDTTATPTYGIYVNYTYGASIGGYPSSFVTSANSSVKWVAAFNNTRGDNLDSEMIAFTRLLSNGTIAKTGTISNTNNSTSYNTSSDYRLKSNVHPLADGIGVVNRMNPVSFNWNTDGEPADGFIAHELAEVVPAAVTGEKDALTPDGYPDYQGVDTSMLVVYLVKAVQQLDTRLNDLRSEVEILKNS